MIDSREFVGGGGGVRRTDNPHSKQGNSGLAERDATDASLED